MAPVRDAFLARFRSLGWSEPRARIRWADTRNGALKPSEALAAVSPFELGAVVTFGDHLSLGAANALGQRAPLVMVAVGQRDAEEIRNRLAPPGGRGATAVLDDCSPQNQLELMLKLDGKYRRVGFLYDPILPERELPHELARSLGMTLVAEAAGARPSIRPALDRLKARRVDVLWLSEIYASDDSVFDAFEEVVRFSREQRLPLVTGTYANVFRGGLATVASSALEAGKEVAERVAAILAGTSAASLPFARLRCQRPAVNLEAARALGLEIPADLRSSAELVHEQPPR